MKPHKHAELIKVWADGAEIEIRTQYTDGSWSKWEVFKEPKWDISYGEYRIKPEPKPDVLKICEFWYDKMLNEIQVIEKTEVPNLKLYFDGETGELKSAEVLK